MDFPIRPNEGVGALNFGMLRSRVRQLLGSNFEEFRKTPESDNTADDFLDFSLHAHYDCENKLKSIDFFEGSNPTFHGKSLIGQPYTQVKKIFSELDANLSDDKCYGFYAPNLGIGSFNSELKNSETAIECIYIVSTIKIA